MEKSIRKYYYVLLKNNLDINSHDVVPVYAFSENGNLIEILTGKKIGMYEEVITCNDYKQYILDNDYSYIGMFKTEVIQSVISSYLLFLNEEKKEHLLKSLFLIEKNLKKDKININGEFRKKR